MALDCIEVEDSESMPWIEELQIFPFTIVRWGSPFCCWVWLLVKMARSFWPVPWISETWHFVSLSLAKFLSPHSVEDAHTCPPTHVESTNGVPMDHSHLFTDLHAQSRTTWAKSTAEEPHDEASRVAEIWVFCAKFTNSKVTTPQKWSHDCGSSLKIAELFWRLLNRSLN
jgi:hypothetical protein